MTSRERFEAWHEQWRAKFGPGSGHSDDMLDAWEEAERQALERAAERCMSILGYPPREYYADAIRALIEPAHK